MSLKLKVLNTICMLTYRPEYIRFQRLCFSDRETIKKQQTKLLLSYVRNNQNTSFGKKYHFSQINSYEDYVKQVPLSVYEDYESDIELIAAGEKNVLTTEDVMMFELTSGSSGAKKMIPYTKTLKKEFQRGIYPWLYDLNKHVEGVRDGSSYWSITPVTAKRSYTQAGIPIGFEEDAEYFGRIAQYLMNQIFAVDSKEVKFVSDMEEFYHKTVTGMLKGNQLSLISVWNPTFLSLCMDYLDAHKEELARELEMETESFREKIFSNLKLISCWADGNAKNQIGDIKKRFPKVMIQPKGVLATECFVSFPLLGEEGSRLSAYSHFFEFRNTETEEIVMMQDLTPGTYEMIVTTGGGFYRYCIGDILEVLEADGKSIPRVRFLRRKGITTDLCGEKLSEDFVKNVCEELGLQEQFVLLTPNGDGYVLYTDDKELSAEVFDAALKKSFHYRYCRELGQLKQVKIRQITGNGADIYIRRMMAEGMRMGDIKPACLSRLSGWDEWFGTEA